LIKVINFIVRWLLVAIVLIFGLIVLMIALVGRLFKSKKQPKEGHGGAPAYYHALQFERVRYNTATCEWMKEKKEKITL
jgi:hypothetical protein